MSLDDFAEAIEIGRSTLLRIEGGERAPKEHELQRMAQISGLPLGFFIVDDLHEVLGGHEDPTITERVYALESRLADIERAISTEPPARVGLPAPGGALGRRLAAQLPTEQDQQRPDSGPVEGARRGSGRS